MTAAGTGRGGAKVMNKMNGRLKIVHFKWAVLALAVQAFGADVTLSINPPLISLGESAQIEVKVRDARRVNPPDFPSVDGLTFSGTGRSSETSILNGHIDKSVSYTTTVYPQKTGEFTIGPFNYKVDGETKTLKGTLKVVTTTNQQSEQWSDLVFAKLRSNRDSAYVQEPFELTLSVYSRNGLQLAGNISIQGMPETGLSDLKWEETGRSRDQINGQIYDVQKFHTTVRTMGAGLYEFSPTITVQVAVPNQQRQRDPFGFDSFFNRVQTRPVSISIDKISVSVLPLPTTQKPAGFTGAVGRFQFEVTAQPLDVVPGDPITLQMTVVGDGNYDRIMPPALPEDAPFRLFGDAVRQQGNNGVRFEQVISPRTAAAKEIPPIEFSFFDTETGKYRTVTSRAIPITVTASSNNTAQVFAASETLVSPPPDQPFATESDVQRFFNWLNRIWKTIHPWLWTIPAAGAVGLVVYIAQKIYLWRRKDTAWLRRQKAPKIAQKALREAAAARKKGDAAAFYNALGEAMYGYFGNRLNLPPGETTAEKILAKLTEKNIDSLQIEPIKHLLESIELYRYGLSGNTPQADRMESMQNITEKELRSIEKLKF